MADRGLVARAGNFSKSNTHLRGGVRFRGQMRTQYKVAVLCKSNFHVNKSSVVAEMGDHLVTIGMGRKVGAAVPLSVGELGHHLTQCGLGRGLPLYQVAS